MLSDNTMTILPVAQHTSRRDMGIIMTMLVAAFVVILNETIMNVALPKLMAELQISASTAQWLATAYMLVMAVLIPTTGFLMQRLTTRTLYLGAMGTFALGTLVAGMAPNFPVLLIGRVFQAAGTAIILPLLTTTILALIPLERRGAMMGTVSIVISVAPAVGPTISGLIVQSLSWRYLFFFVLPIAVAVFVYGARYLHNVGETRSASLDLLSVILAALGFGGVVYGFSSAGEGGRGWTSWQVLVPIVVGVLSLLAFGWRQIKLPAPLLDLRAFRYRMFSLSVLLIMVVMMALFASAILLPIYLQNIRRFTPLQTGLFLLPGGVLMGVAAPFVGRLFDRYGPLALAPTGASLLVLALWRFTTLTAATSVGMLLALHITFSAGLALLFTPIFATGLNQLPRSLHAHGSAIFSTLQQVAGAVGTALLVTIMATGTQAYLRGVANASDAAVQQDALTTGLHGAFTIAGGIALLGLILTLFLRRSSPPDALSEDTAPAAGFTPERPAAPAHTSQP
jgi:DHA2 family lincomycin resistance protein-like MFS transporter